MRNKSEYFNSQIIEARRIEKDFTPDGNLSKSPWKSAKWIEFDTSYDPAFTYPEAMTSTAVLWSEQYIYFAYRSLYSELNIFTDGSPDQQYWELWNRDVVEVFINPFPHRMKVYWEFQVAPNNLWIDLAIDLDRKPFNDATWNSGFEHATRINEEAKIWVCEFRIPVAAFGVDSITADQEWRINLYRCDGLGDDNVRRFLAWCPTYEFNYHIPASFGRLCFLENGDTPE